MRLLLSAAILSTKAWSSTIDLRELVRVYPAGERYLPSEARAVVELARLREFSHPRRAAQRIQFIGGETSGRIAETMPDDLFGSGARGKYDITDLTEDFAEAVLAFFALSKVHERLASGEDAQWEDGLQYFEDLHKFYLTYYFPVRASVFFSRLSVLDFVVERVGMMTQVQAHNYIKIFEFVQDHIHTAEEYFIRAASSRMLRSFPDLVASVLPSGTERDEFEDRYFPPRYFYKQAQVLTGPLVGNPVIAAKQLIEFDTCLRTSEHIFAEPILGGLRVFIGNGRIGWQAIWRNAHKLMEFGKRNRDAVIGWINRFKRLKSGFPDLASKVQDKIDKLYSEQKLALFQSFVIRVAILGDLKNIALEFDPIVILSMAHMLENHLVYIGNLALDLIIAIQ